MQAPSDRWPPTRLAGSPDAPGTVRVRCGRSAERGAVLDLVLTAPGVAGWRGAVVSATCFVHQESDNWIPRRCRSGL